jgi:hypothetical protein
MVADVEDGELFDEGYDMAAAAIAKATGGRETDAELQNSTAGHEP